MQETFFLARFWGIFFFVICVTLLLIGNKGFKEFISLFGEKIFTIIFGFLLLFVGSLSIAYHNIWQWNLAGLMTAFGWLTLGKGIIFILFPSQIQGIIKLYKKNIFLVQMVLGLGALLGVLLVFQGM